MISAEILALLRDGGLHPINIIIITITIFAFGKIKPLLEWYNNTKLEQRENLENAINCEYLSDREKTFLLELKAKSVFAQATGFHGDQRTRELAIDCIEQSCGKITIRHFTIIEKYIKYTDQQLQINITKIEWIWQSALRMIAIFLCLTTPFIFFYFIMAMTINHQINSTKIGLSTILIILTILYIPELIRYQTFNIFYKNNRSLFVQEKPRKIYRIILPIIIFILLVMFNYIFGIHYLFL